MDGRNVNHFSYMVYRQQRSHGAESGTEKSTVRLYSRVLINLNRRLLNRVLRKIRNFHDVFGLGEFINFGSDAV